MVKRSAFTLLELVFAIVLIGIVVAGVPQMITRNDQTLTGNMVQQELFIAAKTASELLTQPWDTNSIDSTTSQAYTKILDLSNPPGGGSLARQQDSAGNWLPFRVGGIRQDNHRRFHNVITTTADFAIPNDAAAPSLPDNTSLTIASGYTGDAANTFLAASPVQSNASADRTAAKMATVTVTNDLDAERSVTLRIYMANIGEVAYAHRRF